MPRVKQAALNNNLDIDDNEKTNESVKIAARRGRPPKKKISARRGRPKGSKNKTKPFDKDRNIKQRLREKIREMQETMRSNKAEFREALRKERQIAKETQRELKEALKREKALINLFEMKDQELIKYANRWTKKQIGKIQSPTKRRGRRKKAA